MLSFSKILLTIAVIVAVFYGVKMFKKLQDGGFGGEGKDSANKGDAGNDTTDLAKCPDCGAYVAKLTDHDCPGA